MAAVRILSDDEDEGACFLISAFSTEVSDDVEGIAALAPRSLWVAELTQPLTCIP